MVSNELPECDNFDNPYFDFASDCYANESKMIDELTTEAIAVSGVMGWFYVVDYSLQNERVFGEDNSRTVIRKFPFMFAIDGLPIDDKKWSKFGIEGMDNFHIQVAKTGFAQASMMMADGVTPAYKSRNPHVGDIIQSTHNNVFYRVLDVKDKADTMLQRAHSFDCIVAPLEMAHHDFAPGLENDILAKFMRARDSLAQNMKLDNTRRPEGIDAFGNLVFRTDEEENENG